HGTPSRDSFETALTHQVSYGSVEELQTSAYHDASRRVSSMRPPRHPLRRSTSLGAPGPSRGSHQHASFRSVRLRRMVEGDEPRSPAQEPLHLDVDRPRQYTLVFPDSPHVARSPARPPTRPGRQSRSYEELRRGSPGRARPATPLLFGNPTRASATRPKRALFVPARIVPVGSLSRRAPYTSRAGLSEILDEEEPVVMGDEDAGVDATSLPAPAAYRARYAVRSDSSPSLASFDSGAAVADSDESAAARGESEATVASQGAAAPSPHRRWAGRPIDGRVVESMVLSALELNPLGLRGMVITVEEQAADPAAVEPRVSYGPPSLIGGLVVGSAVMETRRAASEEAEWEEDEEDEEEGKEEDEGVEGEMITVGMIFPAEGWGAGVDQATVAAGVAAQRRRRRVRASDEVDGAAARSASRRLHRLRQMGGTFRRIQGWVRRSVAGEERG
ncbi:MAG: hypothetical protein M1838_002968, partial [Thelocarpon superellum]